MYEKIITSLLIVNVISVVGYVTTHFCRKLYFHLNANAKEITRSFHRNAITFSLAASIFMTLAPFSLSLYDFTDYYYKGNLPDLILGIFFLGMTTLFRKLLISTELKKYYHSRPVNIQAKQLVVLIGMKLWKYQYLAKRSIYGNKPIKTYCEDCGGWIVVEEEEFDNHERILAKNDLSIEHRITCDYCFRALQLNIYKSAITAISKASNENK